MVEMLFGSTIIQNDLMLACLYIYRSIRFVVIYFGLTCVLICFSFYTSLFCVFFCFCPGLSRSIGSGFFRSEPSTVRCPSWKALLGFAINSKTVLCYRI